MWTRASPWSYPPSTPAPLARLRSRASCPAPSRAPDFRFKNFQVWIDTPDKVFAEYSVEAAVPAAGKVYRQTYAEILIAENGKIKRLREALDTAAAAAAFKGN